MKTGSLPFIFLIALLLGCDTQNNVDPRYERYFLKYYGSEGDQSGADVVANSDGSLILLGNSILPSGLYTAFLVKTDPAGNVVWKRQVGGDNETGADIELIKKGPFAGSLIVASNIGAEANSRIRLTRVTQDGTGIDSVIVQYHQPGGFKQVVKTVTALEQGEGYVITGYADRTLIRESTPAINETNDAADILAFHFDETLALTDTVVTKGGELSGSGIRVFEMSGNASGKFALFGYSDRPILSDQFRFNFTYDIVESGIPIGSAAGNEQDEEVLSSVIRTSPIMGDGYLLAGTSITPGSTTGSVYLVKVSSSFENKGLDRKLEMPGRNMRGVAVENAPFGYYVLADEIREADLKDISLMKVSVDGSIEWSRNFGARDGDDGAAAITVLPDGRIVVVGTIDLRTRKKMALLVLDQNGNF